MYLLDTCVFSELIKKDPCQKVIDWVVEKDEEVLFACSLTFGEIKKGIEKMADGARKHKLEIWFEEFLVRRFWERMIVIDGKIASTWGTLIAKSEQKGRLIPTIDSLIAAAAIANDMHLVTRNTKDFDALPLSLINPWV